MHHHTFRLVKLLTALVFTTGAQRVVAMSYPDGPSVGGKAPGLNISKWMQSAPAASMDLPTNQVVVLEFWSTGCPPCVEAIPHLNQLAEEFKSKPVQFIAVTDDTESEIRTFLSKKPINAWVGLSSDAKLGKDHPYKVYGIPHAVIIDAHGRIAAVTDPREIKSSWIELCLAGKPIPGPNEPDGESVPGVVPHQHQIGSTPMFQFLIRPASQPNQVITSRDNALTFQQLSLRTALLMVYQIQESRLLREAPLPDGVYDFYLSLPWINNHPQDRTVLETVFANGIAATFGLEVKRTQREMDVLVLKNNPQNPAKLHESTSHRKVVNLDGKEIILENSSLDNLVRGLEFILSTPVVDETGLTHNYDLHLKWETTDWKPSKEAVVALVEKQGLILQPAKRAIPVVVVSQIPPQKPAQ